MFGPSGQLRARDECGHVCLRRPSAGKAYKTCGLRGGKSMNGEAEAYRKEST